MTKHRPDRPTTTDRDRLVGASLRRVLPERPRLQPPAESGIGAPGSPTRSEIRCGSVVAQIAPNGGMIAPFAQCADKAWEDTMKTKPLMRASPFTGGSAPIARQPEHGL